MRSKESATSSGYERYRNKAIIIVIIQHFVEPNVGGVWTGRSTLLKALERFEHSVHPTFAQNPFNILLNVTNVG